MDGQWGAGEYGIAGLAIMYFIKETFVVLKTLIKAVVNKRNGNPGNPGGGDASTLLLKTEVHDIHGWLNTEDPGSGLKRVNMAPLIVKELKGIRKSVDSLAIEISGGHERLRESINAQTEVVAANTIMVTTVEEKISEFIKM